MVRQAERESAEDAVQEDASPRGCCRLLSTLCACWAWGASDATGAPLRQGTEVEADTAQGRLDAIKRDQEVLGAFYQHLLAPVEAHLAGATEVLIIPHKELFEVPWAALFDRETDPTVRATRGTFAARGTNDGGRVAGHERTRGEDARWWWATRCLLVHSLCPRQK